MNKEELSIVSMNVITFAGEAKSLAIEALRILKKNDFEKAKKLIIKAKEKMLESQKWHFKALSADAKPDVLFIHAEDQFLSSDTIIILVEEIIQLRKV